MSKKIAILTQPLHVNFGGTLQAFALQKVLISMGFEVETINYIWKESSDLKKILSFSKNFIIGRKPKYFFFNKKIDYIAKDHNKFINTNIILSKKIKDTNELFKYFQEKKFDAVIVGSDQVWRVEYSPNIKNFFLDFLINDNEIKKIAYAASFGRDVWEFKREDTISIKKLIKEFDYISVREDSGVILCRDFLEVKADHVLDPTLLLMREDYLKFVNSNSNKRGVFSYILDNDVSKTDKVDLICKVLNHEKYICMPNIIEKNTIFVKNLKDYEYPQIEEWITSFYKADFVVTDSFHGTVFSILFNKPFISLCNNERGVARFKSLLKIFNLEERLFDNHSSVDVNIINKPIDYNMINSQLNKLRFFSLNKLAESIN